jgi:hypothetical protein
MTVYRKLKQENPGATVMKKKSPRPFRKFVLYRREDECHVSGTGTVAEGIQFSSGRCVIAWLTETPSVSLYERIEDVEAVHGHGGKTVVRWIDADS